MVKILGQAVDDFIGQPAVFGLLGIQRHGGKVVDPEAARPYGFKLKDQGKVVEERAGIAPVLAHPERGLDAGADAGGIHGLVIVGGT